MRPSLIALVPERGAQPAIEQALSRLGSLGLARQMIGEATIFTGDAHAVLPFPATPGAIVGTLFDRTGDEYVKALRPGQCAAIEGSDGRYLAEAFWGGYVALWPDRQSGMLSVFRDPSGALPAFHARVEGCDLVFTDLDLALASGLLTLGIDWGGIAHALRFRQLPTERTGLEGITEILPGQCLTLSARAPRRDLRWSPWSFVPQSENTSREAASLAEIVSRTVAAWGTRYPRLQLELSGGLDSSLIATSLAGRSDSWQCVTFHTPGADGDERNYAHLMAAYASAPIVDVAVRPGDFDLLRPPARLRPRPGGFGVLDAIDHASRDAAAAFGADAIFSGTGGDNVFCYILSATPVLDAMRTAGVAQACRTVADIALLSGTTQWKVLAHVARRALRDAVRPQSWPETEDLLGPAASPAVALHPWLDRPPGTLAGSRTHIASLLRIMPMIDAFDRAADPGMIFPLISQPIIEACLAIPSWRWMTQGRDRAAVRDAFEHRLPATIVGRRSKGRLESAVVPAFERARPLLHDLLVHGQLARNGILDVAAVSDALSGQVKANDSRYTRILELVDAELWAGSIIGADVGTAAGG